MSNNSPQVHRLGVLLLKSRPLNNEVIREVPQNLPRQGQGLHSADALNVDNDHFLYPEDPKEQGRHTDRNTCSWSITQHQVWLYSVNQWEGKPHGVRGSEHGGEPGLPNLPASRNSVKVVRGVLSSGVVLGSSEFKRMDFLGTHFIRLSNDIMPWGVGAGQASNQPQDLRGVSTGSSDYQESERLSGSDRMGPKHGP